MAVAESAEARTHSRGLELAVAAAGAAAAVLLLLLEANIAPSFSARPDGGLQQQQDQEGETLLPASGPPPLLLQSQHCSHCCPTRIADRPSHTEIHKEGPSKQPRALATRQNCTMEPVFYGPWVPSANLAVVLTLESELTF